ncbi:MAG: hypothetical protein ACYDA8_06630 [Deferrisomatales bacterium]
MTGRRPASGLLLAYYAFLLLTTGAAHGRPYPLFGVLLPPGWSEAVLVADCLVLLHILVGVWKAQRLTWCLLLGYNAFELLSLAVTLVRLAPGDLAVLAGSADSVSALYVGVVVSAALMGAITAHALRRRGDFWDRSPYLF